VPARQSSSPTGCHDGLGGPTTTLGPVSGVARVDARPPAAAGALSATAGACALRFEDVAKRFPDGTHTLERVSLALAAGELVGVVGPSGCGKSTLLRLAAGLTPPTAGRIELADRDSVGFVFQDPTLLPWRTVRRNVELLCELHGVRRPERERRAADAIDMLGLSGFQHHHPRPLSGGMRMRVSLPRALTMRPELFLFDEPFGALDELARQRLNEELMRIFANRPFAGLFVTHSVGEAVYLSHRVIVLSDRPGRVVADVPVPFRHPRPGELRFEPAFASVAASVADALRTGGR